MRQNAGVNAVARIPLSFVSLHIFHATALEQNLCCADSKPLKGPQGRNQSRRLNDSGFRLSCRQEEKLIF